MELPPFFLSTRPSRSARRWSREPIFPNRRPLFSPYTLRILLVFKHSPAQPTPLSCAYIKPEQFCGLRGQTTVGLVCISKVLHVFVWLQFSFRLSLPPLRSPSTSLCLKHCHSFSPLSLSLSLFLSRSSRSVSLRPKSWGVEGEATTFLPFSRKLQTEP